MGKLFHIDSRFLPQEIALQNVQRMFIFSTRLCWLLMMSMCRQMFPMSFSSSAHAARDQIFSHLYLHIFGNTTISFLSDIRTSRQNYKRRRLLQPIKLRTVRSTKALDHLLPTCSLPSPANLRLPLPVPVDRLCMLFGHISNPSLQTWKLSPQMIRAEGTNTVFWQPTFECAIPFLR